MPARCVRAAQGPRANVRRRWTGETQQKTLRSGLCRRGRVVDGAILGLDEARGSARGGPRALALRRPQVRPRFPALRVRGPKRAEGRRAAPRHGRHIQHAQSLHAEGHERGRYGPALREPAGRLGGRSGRRLRAGRPERRARARPAQRPICPAARGALARRHPDHGPRRGVLVRDPHHRGPSRLRQPAGRRRPGRDHGRSRGHVPPRRSRQPQVAADRRRAVYRLRGLLPGPRVRRDDDGAAARQRRLSHRQGRSGPLGHLRARRGLLGRRASRSMSAATTSRPSSTTTTATARCWWRR